MILGRCLLRIDHFKKHQKLEVGVLGSFLISLEYNKISRIFFSRVLPIDISMVFEECFLKLEQFWKCQEQEIGIFGISPELFKISRICLTKVLPIVISMLSARCLHKFWAVMEVSGAKNEDFFYVLGFTDPDTSETAQICGSMLLIPLKHQSAALYKKISKKT